ncbi:MAG: type 4a pilus biogenesis protein PilO [Actinomycetes bacterium]
MSRRAILGFVGGTVAVLVLWWVLIYSPKTSATSTARSEASSAERRSLDLEATVARLKELNRNRPELEASLRTLNAAVPATPDLAVFILSANEIAALSGVDFLSISPSPPSVGLAPGAPTTIAISIQVKGGFFAVVDYLNRMEDLERIVVVDGVNLAGQGSGTSSASNDPGADPSAISVTLTARMFTRSSPAGATGATSNPETTGVSGSTGITGSTAPASTTTKLPAN